MLTFCTHIFLKNRNVSCTLLALYHAEKLYLEPSYSENTLRMEKMLTVLELPNQACFMYDFMKLCFSLNTMYTLWISQCNIPNATMYTLHQLKNSFAIMCTIHCVNSSCVISTYTTMNPFGTFQPLRCWWLLWPIQNDAKILKNDQNLGIWVLI